MKPTLAVKEDEVFQGKEVEVTVNNQSLVYLNEMAGFIRKLFPIVKNHPCRKSFGKRSI